MSFVRAVPAALLLALAAPGVAQASATLSVTGTAPDKTLTFTVGDAFGQFTTASVVSGDLVIENSGGIAVGASTCTSVDGRTANCGPAAGFERVVFAFGDGDDQLYVYGPFTIAVSADGGAGDDRLNGGDRDDELRGGPGDDELDGWYGDDEVVGGDGDDYVSGAWGADVIDGGAGDDDVRAGDSPPEADSAISCGPGTDTLVEDDGVDELPDDCETLDPPQLQGSLAITGDPRVGSVLALSIPTNLGGDGVVTIDWFRCAVAVFGCDIIDGAHGANYTPTESDRGSRLLARYWIENGLGADAVWSPETEIVRSALPPHHTPVTHQPVTHQPVMRRPRLGAPPRLALGPFVRARKPSFAMRNGRPVVDTGRSISCRGPFYDYACRLSVTARPSGASARLRRRPAVAGRMNVLVASRARTKVTVPLNRTAYRLLRVHDKLTLSVTATFTRLGYPPLRKTFVITVRAPARHRR